jgi:hypothetical protein
VGPVAGRIYFSGRSDNFAAGANSLDSRFARLDPEGIRVSANGKNVFITDEYGPYIYKFNRKTGERTQVYSLPAATFAVSTCRPWAAPRSAATPAAAWPTRAWKAWPSPPRASTSTASCRAR